MTNKILIDGWNVCHKIPALAEKIPDDLQTAREKLKILVQNYAAGKKIQVKIIYDGQPGIISQPRGSSNIEIQFSRNPESADYKIIRFLKNEKNPRVWTVITSDRELALRAKQFGSSVVSSELFIGKIEKRGQEVTEKREKTSPELTPDEIQFWLDKFNRDS